MAMLIYQRVSAIMVNTSEPTNLVVLVTDPRSYVCRSRYSL
jgi:hypothetical protein